VLMTVPGGRRGRGRHLIQVIPEGHAPGANPNPIIFRTFWNCVKNTSPARVEDGCEDETCERSRKDRVTQAGTGIEKKIIRSTPGSHHGPPSLPFPFTKSTITWDH
jgi:hypothetical protein